MSGKIWDLCRTLAEVCWTCPAYFAITGQFQTAPLLVRGRWKVVTGINIVPTIWRGHFSSAETAPYAHREPFWTFLSLETAPCPLGGRGNGSHTYRAQTLSGTKACSNMTESVSAGRSRTTRSSSRRRSVKPNAYNRRLRASQSPNEASVYEQYMKSLWKWWCKLSHANKPPKNLQATTRHGPLTL